MAKNDLNFNQEAYLKLLKDFLDNAQEERDLALDRYRRQDDQIQTNDDFILQGKNAVEFLKLASARSEALFNVAKELKTIIFKEDAKTGGDAAVLSSDEARRQVVQEIRKMAEENPDIDMDIEDENGAAK